MMRSMKWLFLIPSLLYAPTHVVCLKDAKCERISLSSHLVVCSFCDRPAFYRLTIDKISLSSCHMHLIKCANIQISYSDEEYGFPELKVSNVQ